MMNWNNSLLPVEGKMRLVLTLLLLAANYSSTVSAQAISNDGLERNAPKPTDSKAQLQLTSSIVEQVYDCADFMGFKLRFTFKNIGDIPIILDRRSFVVRVTVGHDLEALAAKQYESTHTFEHFGGDYFHADPSDPSKFIILKPGEVYAFEDGIGSFPIDDDASRPKGYLGAGTHFLQVEIGTWSYMSDYKPLQKKWRTTGYLWAQGLISQPMLFAVNKDRSGSKCLASTTIK
jgi:hypothetical protein